MAERVCVCVRQSKAKMFGGPPKAYDDVHVLSQRIKAQSMAVSCRHSTPKNLGGKSGRSGTGYALSQICFSVT